MVQAVFCDGGWGKCAHSMSEKRGDTANGVSDKVRSDSSRAKPGFAFQTGQDEGKEKEKTKKRQKICRQRKKVR